MHSNVDAVVQQSFSKLCGEHSDADLLDGIGGLVALGLDDDQLGGMSRCNEGVAHGADLRGREKTSASADPQRAPRSRGGDAHACRSLPVRSPSTRSVGVATAAGDPGLSSKSSRSAAASESPPGRSEEHTSELQSLMRISYHCFCLKNKYLMFIII